MKSHDDQSVKTQSTKAGVRPSWILDGISVGVIKLRRSKDKRRGGG